MITHRRDSPSSRATSLFESEEIDVGRTVLVLDADRAAQPPTLEDPGGLANAIFDYIEIFHNRQPRHSALAYRTSNVCELLNDIPV